MIKSPFTIYFDIETYLQYLKKSNQKITNHKKLLKPYLINYILKCNYDENLSKKYQIFTGFNCVSKMLYNLLTKDNDYINDIIEKHFNKEIYDNPDLSKFNRNICHLCNKKYLKKQLKITVIILEKCLDLLSISAIYCINFQKIMLMINI